MTDGVYFIAGTYGVGKSTLCDSISKMLKIPFYSAGDLISEINGEIYVSNKLVKDKYHNQDILIDAVNKKINDVNIMLLAGHFCIFNKNYQVDIIPSNIFSSLHIKKIVLLESDIETIISNLTNRDNKTYPYNDICLLKKIEREQACIISSKLDVPLMIHEMKYCESDTEEICSFLEI